MAQIFDVDEKRTFIETLLVVSGILTAFDSSPIKTSIFVTFAVACLGFIIVISIQKRAGNQTFTTGRLLANWFLAAFVSIFFSALLLLVGLTSSLQTIKTFNDAVNIIGIWFIGYFLLLGLLTYVLGKSD